MTYVIDLEHLDRTAISQAGAKAANLGELMQLDGVRVPRGFCVSTAAFDRATAAAPSLPDRLAELARVPAHEHDAIATISAHVRATIEGLTLPDDVASAIHDALRGFPATAAFAVRSSATAEDLPGASFAGQHDSYLNIVGPAAIVHHVRRCWASLYNARAVTYRRHHGLDERNLRMAVVVQQLVAAEVAGVVFTADPVTSDRRIAMVEATWGLGEALVSGHARPDVYRVGQDEVVDVTDAPDRRATLTPAQVIELVQLGRRIEAHFGCPQDVEWCRADGEFAVVQSRPITTLFPVPARADEDNHVYVSVGHQQMMTEAMRPLGRSFWQLTTPAPMAEAGSRLFVDVTARLGAPASRDALLELISRSDPLTADALRTVLARPGFVRPRPDPDPPVSSPGGEPVRIETDPGVVTALIEHSRASIAAAERAIRGLSGPDLLDFIAADLHELKRILFDPRSHQVFMSAMEAAWWLDDRMAAWLGEPHAADTLTQSVPHNVTSEMGLALLDVADAVRPHPDVVAFLQQVEDDDDFLAALPALAGGPEAHAAITAWLDTYGMRGVGEIDITRPRWRERPSTLVPLILGNVRNFAPGAGARRFDEGLRQARAKERELLGRLRSGPDGERTARETKQMIERVRTFIGYREYPKYGMVCRYFVYKQALMAEAARLVQAGVLRAPQDIFYLTFAELSGVVRSGHVDPQLIARRRETFRADEALTPPRVLTSEGEVVAGTYRRDDAPAGAWLGLGVSAGTVEGRARVITDLGRADLEVGDILVTRYTDPGWTPLFLSAGALVTEVGGLMTHGAVIAREYGLPAVVGVEQATRLIRDGERIRVNGSAGYVEALER